MTEKPRTITFRATVPLQVQFPLPDGRTLMTPPPGAPERDLKQVCEFMTTVPLSVTFPLPDGSTLVPGPLTYNTDGLATQHSAAFAAEPEFAEAYRLGVRTGHNFGDDLHIEWRVFVACWAAWHASRLDGDFVECGVNTGILSRAVVRYLGDRRFAGRRFYLVDTYAGIPEEQLSAYERTQNLMHYSRLFYRDCYEQVKRTFAPFPFVDVVRGKVPDILPSVAPAKVAYLSIDMNATLPEIAAGEWFWDRLVPGAVVVLDDYGGPSHDEQRRSWDAFTAQRGVKVLALPTGQGLILKS
ncbi:MAG: class I SAM-dependent methyltransferase [Alphaproteobacteria bacterium]|nr:class I SAM-dependent methyltransferase [Alphaproteobacteria bacterium]